MVAVGTRVLVLGTTEQQVSVLTELDPDELRRARLLGRGAPWSGAAFHAGPIAPSDSGSGPYLRSRPARAR